ncbi:MAG: sigma-70 family RNA polymerase sigma factor [Pseudomonadota bacterium]
METSATSDEAMMKRYANGDVSAFDKLYTRHELPLWRYILRLCGNRATAEELMQEVWFAVAREAATFRTDARFTSWLYTMARNRVIDRFRTAHPHKSLDMVESDSGHTLMDTLADEHASPLQAAEQSEQGQSIIVALGRLPREQREAFVLQVDAGMTVEQIASVTGTTFETAKSRLRYARERLKDLLREHA